MDMLIEQLIGNMNTKQFHTANCRWGKYLVFNKKKKSSSLIMLPSLEEAIFKGYDGCAICLPKYHRVAEYGVLDVEKATNEMISGKYLYPKHHTKFSARAVDSRTVVAGFTINNHSYSVEQKLDIHGVPESQNVSGDFAIDISEKGCLKKFLRALNWYMKLNYREAPKHLILLGRLVIFKLHEKSDEASLTRLTDKSVKPCDHLKSFPFFNSVNELEGRTGIVKIGELLGEIHANWDRYEERRDSICLYKGEAVQAFWIGENDVYKHVWRIVDGLYGGDNFGRAGSVDLAGSSIDFFTGWNYTAADHDACQSGEGEMLGPCAREFSCASIDFMLSPFFGCNGENPPPEIKITASELQQGYYEYNTVHPLAGRKIGTPAEWEIDLDKHRWQAPPVVIQAKVSGVGATPNPFTQKTGTAITFTLSQTAHVTIRLYHKDGYNMRMLCRNKVFESGERSIYWDGDNSWEIPATLGCYDVEFVVDGVTTRFSAVVRKMANAVGELPNADVLSNVRVSRNPFSVDKKTHVCFDLAEEKEVTIYIYHQNYTFKPINIVRTLADNEVYTKGHHEICWDGYRNSNKVKIQALNGAYKIRILVDGKEKVINNVRKVRKV